MKSVRVVGETLKAFRRLNPLVSFPEKLSTELQMHGEDMPEQFNSVLAAAHARSAPCESSPRISGPFAALVRGTDARGEHFEVETELDDLSASDCHLRLRQSVELGARLFVAARLHKALVAMHSVVLKSEPQEDELSCLSLGIIHHRFLAVTNEQFRSFLLSEKGSERLDSKESQ